MTKIQTHVGSKQIVFGILFDSTSVPALSILSSSLVAGIWYLAASVSQTLLLYRAVQFFWLFQKYKCNRSDNHIGIFPKFSTS